MLRRTSVLRSRWSSRALLVLVLACSEPAAPRPRLTKPHLATLGAPTARLIGAGDIAGCNVKNDSITAAMVSSYLSQYPDAIVYTAGDNAYPDGTAQDYANCYAPTWGRFLSSTRAAIGNHEYDLGNATPTFDYFGDRIGPRDLAYYSYDAGAWHVIVLNSNTSYVPASLGSTQETWLKNDLAANTKSCILAIWHHPRFYSDTGATYGLAKAMRQAWVDLYQAGATLIVNGHWHQYERFAPQDPDGNATPRGIREFIVGTGGYWSLETPTTIAPNSEVQRGRTYGVMELQLGDGWYAWNYMPVPGDAFTDSGTGSCVDRSAEYAPIARPGGPYTGTLGSAVALDGSASLDPDGDLPLTYAWDFGDGTTGTGAKPSHTYADSGHFTVTLTVTDTTGLTSAPATTTATIASSNNPPVASAGGPYTGTTGVAIAFDGSASTDPDGDLPLTYAWDFGDGTTGTGATPSHVYTTVDTFTVTLTVTDSRGLAGAPAKTTAAVKPAPNQPPVADAGGPYAGDQGYAVTLDGSDSYDPDGNLPLSYAWQFGDGKTGTGVMPKHTYATAGTYTVTLTVKDSKGLASAPATSTATIVVDQIPVANPGGPYTGTEGAPVAFDGTASTDPDGNLPLTYAWKFGDAVNGSGATPTHAYRTAGTFTVSLVVTDALGAHSTSVSTTATIANVAPVVNAGPDATATAGKAFTLRWTFTDAGSSDNPWNYTIDWGDGTTTKNRSDKQNVTIGTGHTWRTRGSYTVHVTVTDKFGASGSDDCVIVVQ